MLEVYNILFMAYLQRKMYKLYIKYCIWIMYLERKMYEVLYMDYLQI